MTLEPARFQAWLERCFCRYQLEWILEPSMFSIADKARQIGLSDAIAGDAVLHGCLMRRPQLILSASQDLADEVLTKARQHCETLKLFGVPEASRFAVTNGTEIEWKTGGRIVALPANPRTARSFSGDVHLDEFAYHVDPEGIRDGAFPMASKGNWRVRVLSTPNGAQGLFYDWIINRQSGWAHHHIPIERAERDGFEVDRKKLWSLCGGDERVFAQWYQCKFLDAQLQYIPTAWADRALNWIGAIPQLKNMEIHAGLDVGRTRDLTVLTVVGVIDGLAYVLAIASVRRTRYKAQRKIVDTFRKMFRWETLHVDSTGAGGDNAEELADQYGEDEVVAVHFTNQSKEDLATRALRWFRDDNLRFPRTEEGRLLRNDTIAIQRMVTPSGNVVYDAPRGAEGHADRWWSLCLALKGAGEPLTMSEMGTAPLLAVA